MRKHHHCSHTSSTFHPPQREMKRSLVNRGQERINMKYDKLISLKDHRLSVNAGLSVNLYHLMLEKLGKKTAGVLLKPRLFTNCLPDFLDHIHYNNHSAKSTVRP